MTTPPLESPPPLPSLEDIHAKLAVAEARLQMALNVGGVGIWDWDLLKGTLTWDNRMYILFGVNPATWRPSPESFIALVHPEDQERVIEALRASQADASQEYDLSYRLAHTTAYAIRARGCVQRNPDGTPVRFIGVCIKDLSNCLVCRFNPNRPGCGAVTS